MSSDFERETPGTAGEPGTEGGPALLIRVYDPVEAQIIVAKLRGSGIEAFTRHDALSVVYGLTIDGCGQSDIYVRAEDLEDAQAALEMPDEPAGDEGSAEDGAE